MILPSNDLLSAVFNSNILSSEMKSSVQLDCLKRFVDGDFTFSIIIHELAHRMKEWAYKYGHEMVSYHIQDSTQWRCLYAHISIDLNIDKRVGFYAETEFEAVTKACEYILEQLKDK